LVHSVQFLVHTAEHLHRREAEQIWKIFSD